MKYFLILIVCNTCLSCYGPIAECKFDCVPVPINGRVINKISNEPVPNFPIQLTIRYTFNAGDRIRVLKKFKTDQYGKFNLVYRLDTNNLAVNSYMYLVAADDGYEENNNDRVSKRGVMFARYDPTAFVDITLSVYPR